MYIMSNAKIIHINESTKEPKQLQKNQTLTIIKRLKMLIELKKMKLMVYPKGN